MAVKGKKKKANRGSQARRRPASAPRPTFQPRTRTVWYKTPGGRIVAILFGLLLVGLIVWSVTSSRSEAAQLEQRQEELEDYTQRVRALIQNLTPAATEMGNAAQLPVGQIEKRVDSWNSNFGEAQTTLSQTQPPEDLQPLSQLLLQSILLYVSSAETYELVPGLEADARRDVVTQATVSWTGANNVFASAIALLDDERAEAELRASGLRPPGSGAPPSGPEQGAGSSEPIEIEGDEPEGGGGGGDEEGGNG
jgi:hypothetical protein